MKYDIYTVPIFSTYGQYVYTAVPIHTSVPIFSTYGYYLDTAVPT